MPHPRYLKRYLHSGDIRDWMAYARIEPFGSQHDELLNGIVAAAVVNSQGAKPPAKVTDFMPSYEEPQQTPEQIQSVFAEWKTRLKHDDDESWHL